MEPALKPLEWNRRNADGSIHIATALPGEYWAWELAGYGYWSWGTLSGTEVFGGLDGAKAAAQADYETRIRSALAPATPSPEPIEGLVERLRSLAEMGAGPLGGGKEHRTEWKAASELTRLAGENASLTAQLKHFGELAAADRAALAAEVERLTKALGIEQDAHMRLSDQHSEQMNRDAQRILVAEASLAEARKALEPFASFYDKRHAKYVKRGGSFAAFPDTHPSFDIDADKCELPLGVWREARRLSALGREGEGK